MLGLDQFRVQPEEVARRDECSADAVDGEVGAPEDAARPERLDRGAEGLRSSTPRRCR
jgi:hypothetical protein